MLCSGLFENKKQKTKQQQLKNKNIRQFLQYQCGWHTSEFTNPSRLVSVDDLVFVFWHALCDPTVQVNIILIRCLLLTLWQQMQDQ